MPDIFRGCPVETRPKVEYKHHNAVIFGHTNQWRVGTGVLLKVRNGGANGLMCIEIDCGSKAAVRGDSRI